jgi:spermidine/putrescine transport system permease protein
MIANMIYAQIFDLNDRPMGATLAVLAMAIVALSLLWLIARIRFWLWLAETRGTGWALGLALVEILVIRTIFVAGPGLIGAPASVLGLLALATLGSVLIFLRVPRGRAGI